MRNFFRICLLAGAFPLVGCSLFTATGGTPATPQEVAAAENGFIAADGMAMAYMTLPPCAVPKPTSGAGAICSDPATKALIKAKEQVAYTAFTTFQAATAAGSAADMAALDAAIAAMVNTIPTPTAVPAPAAAAPATK